MHAAETDRGGTPGRHRLLHPLRVAEHEAERLRDIAARGESELTPVILIGTWIAVVVPLVALAVGLAFGAAYLVTGSSGTSYPAATTAVHSTQRSRP